MKLRKIKENESRIGGVCYQRNFYIYWEPCIYENLFTVKNIKRYLISQYKEMYKIKKYPIGYNNKNYMDYDL